MAALLRFFLAKIVSLAQEGKTLQIQTHICTWEQKCTLFCEKKLFLKKVLLILSHYHHQLSL